MTDPVILLWSLACSLGLIGAFLMATSDSLRKPYVALVHELEENSRLHNGLTANESLRYSEAVYELARVPVLSIAGFVLSSVGAIIAAILILHV